MTEFQKNFKIKFELNEIININSLNKWSKLIKKTEQKINFFIKKFAIKTL